MRLGNPRFCVSFSPTSFSLAFSYICANCSPKFIKTKTTFDLQLASSFSSFFFSSSSRSPSRVVEKAGHLPTGSDETTFIEGSRESPWRPLTAHTVESCQPLFTSGLYVFFTHYCSATSSSSTPTTALSSRIKQRTSTTCPQDHVSTGTELRKHQRKVQLEFYR